MNKKIRKSIFETNSSSCHSLTYESDDKSRDEVTITKEYLSNNDKLIVPLKNFDGDNTWCDGENDYSYVYGWYNKLSYLITYLYCYQPSWGCCSLEVKSDVLSELYKDEDFIAIQKAIKNYLGYDIQVENLKEAYISNLYGIKCGDVDFKNEDSILDFIFCGSIMIVIENWG